MKNKNKKHCCSWITTETLGKISILLMAAVGVIIVALAAFIYLTPSAEDERIEVGTIKIPPVLIVNNDSTPPLQGFMSKTVKNANNKSFATFTDNDISRYEEKKEKLLEKETEKALQKAKEESDVALSDEEEEKIKKTIEEKLISKIEVNNENRGVLYLFNNLDKEISFQEIAESISPDTENVFAIAKWDAEAKWKTKNNKGEGMWKMTYNTYYAADYEKDGKIYISSERVNLKGQDKKDKEGNLLRDASKIKVKPGEGFMIISLKSIEILNHYDGLVKKQKPVDVKFDACSITEEGWYNFAVVNGATAKDYFKECPTRLSIVWPQVQAQSCETHMDQWKGLIKEDRNSENEQCFTKNGDYKTSHLINYIRLFDKWLPDFNDKDFLKKFKIAEDTKFRTVWVYVTKEDPTTPEEPTVICPEYAENINGRCITNCKKSDIFTLTNAVWIDKDVEITQEDNGSWSEPEICKTECINDKYIENTNVNSGEIKCTKKEEDTTCEQYNVKDENIKWLTDAVSEDDNRCQYTCADNYHPEIVSEDGATTSGEAAPPDMEKFNPGDDVICIADIIDKKECGSARKLLDNECVCDDNHHDSAHNNLEISCSQNNISVSCNTLSKNNFSNLDVEIKPQNATWKNEKVDLVWKNNAWEATEEQSCSWSCNEGYEIYRKDSESNAECRLKCSENEHLVIHDNNQTCYPISEGCDSADIILTNSGASKINVIKAIRDHTDLSLTESKKIADNTPSFIAHGSIEKIIELENAIKIAGGTSEVECKVDNN